MLNIYMGQLSRVNWNGSISRSFPVANGVKQGAILSPVLFCIYIDGLLERLKNANIGCFIGGTYVGALAYADDITLLAPTASAMRAMIKLCEGFASEYSIKFNVNKSKYILFKPIDCRYTVCRPVFYIGKERIENVSSWPHLGNILSETQNDEQSIIWRKNIFIGQANDVLCFFKKLKPSIKIRLLYAYCSSLYGSVLWDISHVEINRLSSAWGRAIKVIWKLPFNTHKRLLFPLCDKWDVVDDLCHRILRFFVLCSTKGNETV